MNPDLLTLNLKKNKTSNESFWLMGQPDVEVKKQKEGKYLFDQKGTTNHFYKDVLRCEIIVTNPETISFEFQQHSTHHLS